MPKRKVIARGYFNRRVWEPGEELDVPEGFKASWLESDAPAEPVRRRRKKAEPEVTEETEASDDDAS